MDELLRVQDMWQGGGPQLLWLQAVAQFQLLRPTPQRLALGYDIDFANAGIIAETNDNQDDIARYIQGIYRAEALDSAIARDLIAIEDAGSYARVMNSLSAEIAVDLMPGVTAVDGRAISTWAAGRGRATLTASQVDLAWRTIVTSIFSSGCPEAIAPTRSSGVVTGSESIAVIRSPTSSPATSAAEPGATATTSAPGKPADAGRVDTPSNACRGTFPA